MSGQDRRRPPERDLVREYKDAVAGLDAAATALRAREVRQADTLGRRLDELARAAAAAEERAALARLGAELAWDRVLDRLFYEDWMTLRAHPRPDPEADPDDLDTLAATVERTAEAVLEASRRRTFGFGRR